MARLSMPVYFSLDDPAMLNGTWIDWPVDTRGCTPASTSLPCSMEVQSCPCRLRPVIGFGASAVSETRKLAAILVSDVVGYSRLAGADEDRTLSRLRGLRSDLVDPAIAAHHGRVVKRTGDGSIIEFRSVVDAVRCAIEVQNGLIERNAGLPPERASSSGSASIGRRGRRGRRRSDGRWRQYRRAP